MKQQSKLVLQKMLEGRYICHRGLIFSGGQGRLTAEQPECMDSNYVRVNDG